MMEKNGKPNNILFFTNISLSSTNIKQFWISKMVNANYSNPNMLLFNIFYDKILYLKWN